MRLNVRAFARVREIMGAAETAVDAAGDACVRDVWALLLQRHSELEAFDSSIRFARNGSVVPRETRLADGDEVALLPPVSGG